jgi:glycopeptide antibiotics resistance protein
MVAALSFLPMQFKHDLHTEGRFHLLGHWLVFLVTGFLLVNNTRSVRNRLLLLIFALIFGYSIEITQHLVFQIELEQKDVLIDGLGIVCGSLLAVLLERFKLLREPIRES